MKSIRRQSLTRGIAMVTVASGFASGASVVAAQGIEEILVTARKIEESQQTVPVTLTALSGDMITKAAITNIHDVRVPGLYITSDTQGGQATFAIRAAKQGNGTSDTVTAYVGDMPMATNYAIANMMYDMQSIQVLKGPQGTLFGANSTGGAIIFTPNSPGEDFEGYVDVGYGNYDRKSFQGMINIPVSDTFQVRFAGEIVDRDEGYVQNHPPIGLGNGAALPDTQTELWDDKHESARLGIHIQPSDAWDNQLILEYFHEDNANHPEVPAAVLPEFIFGGFLPVSWPQNGGFLIGDRDNVIQGGMADNSYRKNEIYNVMWTSTYQLNDDVSLKNVLGFQDAYLGMNTDNDMSAWSIVNGSTEQWIEQWSWEPSIDWSAMGGKLRNKTGVFLSGRDWDWGNSYSLIQIPLADPLLAFGFFPVTRDQIYNTGFIVPAPIFGPFDVPIGALPETGFNFYNREIKSRAIYTQFSYDLADTTTATLGLRYSWDEIDYTIENATKINNYSVGGPLQGNYRIPLGMIDGVPVVCRIPDAAYTNWDPVACLGGDSDKFQAPSFTFSLEHQYSDNSMVYATTRGGYLLGGFNNNIEQAAANLGLLPSFGPEKVVDFEVGNKSDWDLMGRPIRTNLAAFYGTYKDQQRFQNGNVNGVNLIGTVNAGSSTFFGFDIEVTYLPTDNLDLTLSWNHVETEYTKFESFISGAATVDGVTAVPATLDLSGEELAQAPNDVLNISATYSWPVPSEVGSISSTLSYFWTSETFSQDTPVRGCSAAVNNQCQEFNPILDFTEYDEVPSYDLVNFTTQWSNVMGSSVDVNVWVNNLTDEKYWTSVSNQMLVFGYATRIYGAPRTYGMNLRYNF